MQSHTAPREAVDVEIRVLDPDGSLATDPLEFENLPIPLQLRDIDKRLLEHGYESSHIISVWGPMMEIEVTDGPSEYNLRHYGAKINIDQPLLHFYNQVYLNSVSYGASGLRKVKDSSPSVLNKDNTVSVGNIAVGFHRTVRVPDNDIVHILPPDMGLFPLFNISHYTDSLPESMLLTGGIFLPIYQREAMWLSLRSVDGELHAVKIYVGGINVMTGLKRGEKTDKEDTHGFIYVKSPNEPIWIDGILVQPGIVRQFVAMPLRQGYTVESQVTGEDSIGGVQIEVYDLYKDSVQFEEEDGLSSLENYRTPRQLDQLPGSLIRMHDTDSSRSDYSFSKVKNLAKFKEITVPKIRLVTYQLINVTIIIDFPSTAAGDDECRSHTPITMRVDPCSTIGDIIADINSIRNIEINPSNQSATGLFLGLELKGRRLGDNSELREYFGVTDGSEFHLKYYETAFIPGKPRGQTTERPSTDKPPKEEFFNGFAAGGRISQNLQNLQNIQYLKKKLKVSQDILSPTAYDERNPTVLNVTVINASYFNAVTGLDAPETPISAATYIEKGLPWFKVYDEVIPTIAVAEKGSQGPRPLLTVQSIGEILTTRTSAEIYAVKCRRCGYELATISLRPCGHRICDDCAGTSASTNICPIPSCRQTIDWKNAIAAQMAIMGTEDYLAIDRSSISRVSTATTDSRVATTSTDQNEPAFKHIGDVTAGARSTTSTTITIKPPEEAEKVKETVWESVKEKEREQTKAVQVAIKSLKSVKEINPYGILSFHQK